MSLSMRLSGLSIVLAGIVAVALAAGANAYAQSSAPAVSARPGAAAASASGLGDFKGYRPAEPTDWRAANARVAAVGGWRAYAREQQQQAKTSEPQPSLQPAPVGASAPAGAASASGGHSGHRR